MMKLFGILLWSALFFQGCGAQQIGCPDEIDKVVFDKMYSQFGGYDGVPNYLTVWLSHNYEAAYWNPMFDKWQKKLDATRKWSTNLQDRCLCGAYKGWLDYYQDELDSARSELSTQDTKKEMDAYDAKNRDEHKRKSEYEKRHKVPSPPM